MTTRARDPIRVGIRLSTMPLSPTVRRLWPLGGRAALRPGVDKLAGRVLAAAFAGLRRRRFIGVLCRGRRPRGEAVEPAARRLVLEAAGAALHTVRAVCLASEDDRLKLI